VKRFPAHDELGTCRTSLVSPEQYTVIYSKKGVGLDADLFQPVADMCLNRGVPLLCANRRSEARGRRQRILCRQHAPAINKAIYHGTQCCIDNLRAAFACLLATRVFTNEITPDSPWSVSTFTRTALEWESMSF